MKHVHLYKTTYFVSEKLYAWSFIRKYILILGNFAFCLHITHKYICWITLNVDHIILFWILKMERQKT